MKLIIAVALLYGITLADSSFIRNRAGEIVYYIGYCQNNLASVGGVITIGETDNAITLSACDQLGGQPCDRGCVIAGDRDTPDLTRSSWKTACRAAGAGDAELVRQDDVLKEAVMDLAGC